MAKNNKKHWAKGENALIGILIAVASVGAILCFVIGGVAFFSGRQTSSRPTATRAVQTAAPSNAPSTQETQGLSSAPEASAEPGSTITTAQSNALRAAKNYLNAMPFSHDGLVKQLEYESYSHDDAVYAADNCGADWSEQALKSAQNYLNATAFSYAGLIKQLEYDGFTAEQAAYGAEKCNADWNEQAAKAAKNYLDIMPFSRDELIDQLKFDGYTDEQAAYGAEANGY